MYTGFKLCSSLAIDCVSKYYAAWCFDSNFGKCGPIFKILSPIIDSLENSLCMHHKDFHLTCILFETQCIRMLLSVLTLYNYVSNTDVHFLLNTSNSLRTIRYDAVYLTCSKKPTVRFSQLILPHRRRRFWRATHDCVAPYVDIILHRGRFWAKSAASGSVRWWCFRSCWMVLSHVMRGRPSCLLQSAGGEANRILLASALLSMRIICPNKVSRRDWGWYIG